MWQALSILVPEVKAQVVSIERMIYKYKDIAAAMKESNSPFTSSNKN